MGGASGSANARIVGVSVRLASRQVIAGVVPPLSKGVSTDERRYGYLASALLEWMRVSSSFDIPAPAGMCAEAIEMLSRSGTSGSQEVRETRGKMVERVRGVETGREMEEKMVERVREELRLPGQYSRWVGSEDRGDARDQGRRWRKGVEGAGMFL